MIWFLTMACHEEIKAESKDTSTVEDTQPDTETDSPDTQPPSVDTGVLPPAIQGNFTGGIDVQLYTLSPALDREFISWEEAYPDGSFPFGNIFVGAYYINTVGETVWLGSDVIENPQATGNSFQIDYELDLDQEVRVFAILDFNKDNITGTDEPLGVYPRGIQVDPEESSFENLSIDILSPLYETIPDCAGGVDQISIDGEAILTATYEEGDGDIAIILMKVGNVGPIHSQVVTPEPDGNGAVGDYVLYTCPYDSSFPVLLKGIWDNNKNGMFDPTDESGTYIKAPNESGNPITVGFNNLSDYEIQIPFASSSALNIVPFVQLSGPVIPENGSFNTYQEGSKLYMTAMKYRVEQEFNVDVFEEQAYGVVEYEWDDLQNKSFVPWEITVPSQTIAYLWAYIDTDNDGLVNEPGEPIAVVAGGEDGRYPTGDESQSDIQMLLTSSIDGDGQ